MTKEDIICMAREAGFEHIAEADYWHPLFERFATLVASAAQAKEREACAKVADTISDKYGWGYYGNEVDTADEIASAIRARNNQ
jgi:hypothetical protein